MSKVSDLLVSVSQIDEGLVFPQFQSLITKMDEISKSQFDMAVVLSELEARANDLNVDISSEIQQASKLDDKYRSSFLSLKKFMISVMKKTTKEIQKGGK